MAYTVLLARTYHVDIGFFLLAEWRASMDGTNSSFWAVTTAVCPHRRTCIGAHGQGHHFLHFTIPASALCFTWFLEFVVPPIYARWSHRFIQEASGVGMIGMDTTTCLTPFQVGCPVSSYLTYQLLYHIGVESHDLSYSQHWLACKTSYSTWASNLLGILKPNKKQTYFEKQINREWGSPAQQTQI